MIVIRDDDITTTIHYSDLVSYDVESDEVEVLCDGTSSQSEY